VAARAANRNGSNTLQFCRPVTNSATSTAASASVAVISMRVSGANGAWYSEWMPVKFLMVPDRGLR
jgi:hypothetical protein